MGFQGLKKYNKETDDLDSMLSNPTDVRWLAVGQALLHENYTVDRVHELTKIDKWFLHKLMRSVELNNYLRDVATNLDNLTRDVLLRAKQLGFSDHQIALLLNTTELSVRKVRTSQQYSMLPFVNKIDTLALNFPQIQIIYTPPTMLVNMMLNLKVMVLLYWDQVSTELVPLWNLIGVQSTLPDVYVKWVKLRIMINYISGNCQY